jgi:hypothetical protein
MTRVEEEKVTTTYEEVDPPKPRVENVNVNTKGDTISVNEPPAETSRTHTETTHTEVHESD